MLCVASPRWALVSADALIVSGAAFAAESTTPDTGFAEVLLLLQAPDKNTITDKIISFPQLRIIHYFFRKNSRSGTPLKSKFSRNLFSR